MAAAAASASDGAGGTAGCRSIERRDSSRLCRCRWCFPARLPRRVRATLLLPRLSPDPASDAGAGGVLPMLCDQLPDGGSRNVPPAPCKMCWHSATGWTYDMCCAATASRFRAAANQVGALQLWPALVSALAGRAVQQLLPNGRPCVSPPLSVHTSAGD